MTGSSKQSTETVVTTPEDKELETFRKSVTPNIRNTSFVTVGVILGAILVFGAFFYGITHQHDPRPPITSGD